jgi:hypothetical protein
MDKEFEKYYILFKGIWDESTTPYYLQQNEIAKCDNCKN